jgi:hypothetical protein
MSYNFLSLRCPDCGEKITKDDSLCPHCGTDLDAPLGDIERRTIAKQYSNKAQKTYNKGGNVKSALGDIDLAIQCEPESAEFHNLRGLILDAIGKTDDAINSYREAIRLNPNFGDAKANLIDAESDFSSESRKKLSNSSSQQNMLLKIAIGVISALVIIWFILGIGLIYVIGRDYFGPKSSIVFEPDYSQISTMDSSVLEKTAEILTTRTHNLGYTKISFIVTDNGQIISKVPSYIDTKSLVEKISPIGLLEFVDFGNTPLPVGTVISTDLEDKYIQQTSDAKRWHTIMANEGIIEASIAKDQEGNFQIMFSLTEKGKIVFAEHTTANVGSYLGIVLDKSIISMPMISQPIINGQGMISGAFTQESAKNLAAILKTTPLPIPIKLIQDVDAVK